MEIKEITPEIREKLRAPLPKEAVKQHPTKTYLSSIKPMYVIERLNDVFGVGKWKYTKEIVEKGSNGMVVVDVNLTVPEYGIEYSSYGGNDNGGENSKNFDLGDAYKGAVTDAITKISSFLEIGIDVFKGLQGHDGNGNQNTAAKPTAPSNAPWANDNEVNAAISRINSGEQGVLESILSTHKLSKANRAKIESAIANYKPQTNEKKELKPGTEGWIKTVSWLAANPTKAHTIKLNYIIDDSDFDSLLSEAKEKSSSVAAPVDIPVETLDAIRSANDMPTLNKIYNDCQELHSSKAFIDAYAARQKELAKLGKAA